MARIREGVRKSTLFSLAWSITGGLLVIFGGQFLTQLFVGESDAAVLQQSQFYLNIMGVFLFPLGQLFIYRNVLQGMGRGGVPVFVWIILAVVVIGGGVAAVVIVRKKKAAKLAQLEDSDEDI